MIVIWRGWGIAVPVIVVVLVLAMELLVDKVTGTPAFRMQHSWVWLLDVLPAALALWWLGRKLESRPGRVVIDKQTHTEFELKAKHDLFWIPVKWWALPLLGLGLLFTLV
ncbi:hypothetical protein [Pseudaeromonas paramecii]|uniref:Uncharacterized protein n=1 Tax=Pseudaeromonas paramecii TaxID=2138166 RepID=A0ABP8QII3_9GAMM